MERLQTFEQYKEIVNTAKKAGYRFSNCFFLPTAIKQKITMGTLYFLWIKNGLLLLDDCSDFYRCYYYLHNTKQPNHVALDKDAVIEFPFIGSIGNDQQEQIQKINRMGFYLGRESGLMIASPGCIKSPGTSNKQINSIICDADLRDINEILDIFRLSFNPLFAFLPSQNELHASIKAKSVLVIRDENHRVIAALNSGFEKGVASIRQVAVDPAFRGIGLGKQIIQEYHTKYLEEAKQFQQWVDRGNSAAINVYQQFGYEFSIRRANEYVSLRIN